jgi:hypothetical protein
MDYKKRANSITNLISSKVQKIVKKSKKVHKNEKENIPPNKPRQYNTESLRLKGNRNKLDGGITMEELLRRYAPLTGEEYLHGESNNLEESNAKVATASSNENVSYEDETPMELVQRSANSSAESILNRLSQYQQGILNSLYELMVEAMPGMAPILYHQVLKQFLCRHCSHRRSHVITISRVQG